MLSTFKDWEITADSSFLGDLHSPETISWRDDSGPLVVSYVDAPGAGHYRLRQGDQLIVDVCEPRRIVARAVAGTPKATLDHFLTDQVFPRVMAHEGQFIIHAAATRFGKNAVLFMGASGRGKSTLATSFDRAGLPLLGDDAMVISWSDGKPRAKAVYPSLRLFPDSMAALIPTGVSTSDIALHSAKQRVNFPAGEKRALHSLPVEAIFAIGAPTYDDRIHVRRLKIAEACIALIENSFALDPTDIERARDRLAKASEVARAIPAFEIFYPRDYERLPAVRSAILAKLAAEHPSDGPV